MYDFFNKKYTKNELLKIEFNNYFKDIDIFYRETLFIITLKNFNIKYFFKTKRNFLKECLYLKNLLLILEFYGKK